MNASLSGSAVPTPVRLTSLSHGGGCGCKIAPGVLSEILKNTASMPLPPELLVGIETSDDAAVYQLNEEQALIATTDFLARSFTWQWPGLPALRGLGLAALQALPPVKAALAKQMMFGRR